MCYSLAIDKEGERMEPNREHDCKSDGCNWEHLYGCTVCRECGSEIPRDMTPSWLEQ